MIFLEEETTWLLVVHAVLGGALVAASTHWLVWVWGYRRGRFARHRGARRFAVITSCLFVATFLVGNLLYPAYKVRVRAEFLDNPVAIARDQETRAVARVAVDRFARVGGADAEAEAEAEADRELPTAEPPRAQSTAKLARWFDVKEHWAALGLALALAATALLLIWDPERHGDALGLPVWALVLATAGSTWFGAVVGLLVTAQRAV
jgi:hypothetical protein